MGLAAWSARRADLLQDKSSSATPRSVEGALDRDFVAADVAGLLLNDLPHVFLAWDRTDRAAMLELAWGRRCTTASVQPWIRPRGARPWPPSDLGPHPRQRELDHAGAGPQRHRRRGRLPFPGQRRRLHAAAAPTEPAGIATAVESSDDRPRRRRLPRRRPRRSDAVDILPSTNELIDYLCPTEDVPLSTAAHISARFPYVSPTGRIERRGCPSSEGLVPAPAVS